MADRLARTGAVNSHRRVADDQFYDSFETPHELLEKYRDLMSGIASLNFLAGFCYTQLTDVEQEINGLLIYDRQPKLAAENVAAIYRELFPESN